MKTWQQLKENPALFKRYFVKEYITKACRKFFEHRSYHELESPILAFALPQERYCDVLEVELTPSGFATSPFKQRGSVPTCRDEGVAYLIPTTETYNKKILAAGLGEHFVITKVARAMEDIGPNHSPEFTMLEWYHLDANYNDLMKDCEELFIFIKKFLDLALGVESYPHVKGKSSISKVLQMSYEEIDNHKVDYSIKWIDQEIDLSPNWEKLDVYKALKSICNIRLEDIQDEKAFKDVLIKKGYNVDGSEDWQILFEWVFSQEIEPTFPKDRPIFVYNYPKQVCPLTRTNKDNPLVCEKVELYIAGKELANGYTELLDWEEQNKRFLVEQEARKKLGKKPIKFDHDLVEALKSGLPDVAGIGMGLDRVAMLFADVKNVSDVNYFPASEWINPNE